MEYNTWIINFFCFLPISLRAKLQLSYIKTGLFFGYKKLFTSSLRPFYVSFSRHLPMIAAQLRGRVHLKSKEFANQQHILVFSHILGVLDLLRPHIFRQDKVCGLFKTCHTTNSASPCNEVGGIKFTDTLSYTWVERGTANILCPQAFNLPLKMGCPRWATRSVAR